MTNGWSVNRLAAQAVALHGQEEHSEPWSECAHCAVAVGLLDMIGLITPSRVITPDDRRNIELANINDSMPVERVGPGIAEPRLDKSLVPPGLATLPPVQRTPPKPVPPPKPPRKVAKCGTLAGRRRHVREGEPVCRPCKDAQNEYQRVHPRRSRAKAKPTTPAPSTAKHKPFTVNPDLPPRPETCGTKAGRSNHLRRGERLCTECADVHNAHQRATRKSRAKAKQEGR